MIAFLPTRYEWDYNKTQQTVAHFSYTHMYNTNKVGPRHLDEVDVVIQLHGARLDPEDLQTTLLVGDADVELAVEPPEPPQRRLDNVGPVRGGDDHHVGGGLDAVHESEELGNDALLDFTASLVPPRRDRV